MGISTASASRVFSAGDSGEIRLVTLQYNPRIQGAQESKQRLYENIKNGG
jgi:hypothetical protein